VLYHSIDNFLELNHNHTLNGNRNFLTEIASCDGVTYSGDVLDLCFEEFEFLDCAHA
jgi:hypothetical protein